MATVGTAAHADEPDAELLPAPRELKPEAVLPPAYSLPGSFVVPAYYRASHYDIWQLYAVDRRGTWRPRVIYTPHGAFYLYNGQPYPWAQINPRDWIPAVTDSPAGT